jgi:hypothetical protein
MAQRMREQGMLSVPWHDGRTALASLDECRARINAKIGACFLAAVALKTRTGEHWANFGFEMQRGISRRFGR